MGLFEDLGFKTSGKKVQKARARAELEEEGLPDPGKGFIWRVREDRERYNYFLVELRQKSWFGYVTVGWDSSSLNCIGPEKIKEMAERILERRAKLRAQIRYEKARTTYYGTYGKS